MSYVSKRPRVNRFGTKRTRLGRSVRTARATRRRSAREIGRKKRTERPKRKLRK